MPTKTLTLLTPLLAFIHLPLFGTEGSTTVLDLIRPDAANSALIETLGDPVSVEQHEGLQVSTFTKPDTGIAAATTWCDQDGTIQWARIQLVNELPPDAVRLLYTLVGGQTTTEGHAFADTERKEGRTDHYQADGVHFFTVNGVVREIWRTAPRVDSAAIRTASKAHWPSVLPAGAPSGATNGAIPDASSESRNPRQILSVGPISTQVVKTPEGFAAQLTGSVRAVGLEGQEIVMLVFFYSENGTQALRAAPTAPAALRGPRGEIFIQMTDRVQHADAVWTDLTFELPLQHIEGFENLYGKFVLRMEVFCGSKAVLCTGEIDLRLPDTPPSRPDRQVRIGNEPQVEEWTTEDGPGLLIHIPVEVYGCLGLNFGCRVALRKPDGTPVQASSGWDNWRTSEGDFYALGLSEVEFESSSWTPYNIFVPFAALDLAPGEQPLVVRLSAFCDNVGTVLEFDTTIVKP